MNKIYASTSNNAPVKSALFFIAWLLIAPLLHAQPKNPPHPLGNITHYVNGFKPQATQRQQPINVQVNEFESFEVNVDRYENTEKGFKVYGAVEGHEASRFFIDGHGNEMKGNLVLMDTKEAFEFFSDANGQGFVQAVDINKVVCINYNRYDKDPTKNTQATPRPEGAPIPLLESKPGAAGVIYLDFDGETVSGGRWGAITASSFNHTDQVITDIWLGMQEDYLPFDVNVTTDRSVYDNAPVNRRMMVIFTPDDDAAPGAGGVAYLWSFSDNSDDPCWVFNDGVKGGMEAGSHEGGHTLGLSHDGDADQGLDYYEGHGGWGPIMGAVYGRPLVQWCKGEYLASDNSEDDIDIISSAQNGLGFRTDDHGDNTSNATALVDDGNGNLDPAQNNGIISERTDKDVWSFTTPGGPFNVTIGPRSDAHKDVSNLDIQARLLDSGGNELAVYNPQGLKVTFTTTMPEGSYFLEIDGVGDKDPLTDGYSDYSSLGYYQFSGSYTVGTLGQPPVAEFINSTANCTGTIQFTDQSLYSVTSWNWDFGDGSQSTDKDPEHTYTQSGTYTVTLSISGPNGNDSETKTNLITVYVPEITSTEGDTSCNPAALTLMASGQDDIEWYDAATGGNLVGSGSTFTTPTLSTSTSYWASAKVVEADGNVGATDNSMGAGESFTANDIRGLYFDVLSPVEIVSVKVYAGAAGTRTIEVLDQFGNTVHSKPVSVPAGESRIDLNYKMDVGTNYFIKCTGTVDLFRNSAGAVYPYTYPGFLSITNSNASIAGYYYFFYDWHIQANCSVEPRVEVVGVIGAGKPVIAYNDPILSTTTVADSYQWYLDGSPISGATSNSYNHGGIGGSYTVEITIDGCTGISDPYVITSLPDPEAAAFIKIFPNPGNGLFHIRSEIPGAVQVRVFSTVGQEVFNKSYPSGNNIEVLDLRNLQNGMYMVEVHTREGIYTRRLVKQ